MLASAPCSNPCSFAGTACDISACTAGCAIVQPKMPSAMTGNTIHPCGTTPYNAQTTALIASPIKMARRSPSHGTITRTSPPCPTTNITPTIASDRPVSVGPQPKR